MEMLEVVRGGGRGGGRQMLKLRRGVVTRHGSATVRVGEEERPAWADEALVGEIREGDEVIVNIEALRPRARLGRLRRRARQPDPWAGSPGAEEAHAMKLNYTSLQHPVEPVEARADEGRCRDAIPVLVLSLHGQLAPAAWAAARGARPG